MDIMLVVQIILSVILIAASIGVVAAKKPVHSSLFFLLSLFTLAALYLEMSAQFIAVMQVLVYAGAILVLFIFVMVLFQDAYKEIRTTPPESRLGLLIISIGIFLVALIAMLTRIPAIIYPLYNPADGYGTAESMGELLYVAFFFPFEAVTLLFLVAIVGALYIGRKVV